MEDIRFKIWSRILESVPSTEVPTFLDTFLGRPTRNGGGTAITTITRDIDRTSGAVRVTTEYIPQLHPLHLLYLNRIEVL